MSDAPSISAHRSGNLIWLDMITVPTPDRGQGKGRACYEEWEASLPGDIERVLIFASDTGSGPTDGFWEALGFEYQYSGQDLPYETEQKMWKGVNGHPTPPTVCLD